MIWPLAYHGRDGVVHGADGAGLDDGNDSQGVVILARGVEHAPVDCLQFHNSHKVQPCCTWRASRHDLSFLV